MADTAGPGPWVEPMSDVPRFTGPPVVRTTRMPEPEQAHRHREELGGAVEKASVSQVCSIQGYRRGAGKGFRSRPPPTRLRVLRAAPRASVHLDGYREES